MINRVFQLVAPKQFAVKFDSVSINSENVIVRPEYLSICAADQRYYTGRRSVEALREKLPMALIHECCGEVVYDGSGMYAPGQKVLLVPNQPGDTDDGVIRANYAETSRFRASGFDGFMQEFVSIDRRCVVPYASIEPEVAAICELISVAMHSVNTFLATAHANRDSCAVFGDGNVGYLVSLLLRELCPDMKIYVFGIVEEKLAYFSFADEVFKANDIPAGLRVDHAFECVGGSASEDAISSIIDIIRPQGNVMLMGVSEKPVAINTRMVLERGLTLIGRSRSVTDDFVAVRDLLEGNTSLQDRLKKIIREVVTVSNIPQMQRAFDEDLISPFKTVMRWNV